MIRSTIELLVSFKTDRLFPDNEGDETTQNSFLQYIYRFIQVSLSYIDFFQLTLLSSYRIGFVINTESRDFHS